VSFSFNVAVSAFGVVSLFLAGTVDVAAQDNHEASVAKPFVLATGVVTGVYYPVGGALCQLVNRTKAQHGRHCLVEATEGPVYNLNALRSGEADAALVQSDWQRMAFKGEGRFAAAGPFAELRAVATLYPETLTLIARPDAEIRGVAELKGKRVNYGPQGSALRSLTSIVLDAFGQDIAPGNGDTPPDDAAQALCEGQLDAAFFAVGHPNGTVRRAMSECGAVIVPITGAALDKLLSDHPEMVQATVPASLYPGQQEDIATVGVAATLVVRADADDGAVAELARVLKEEGQTLAIQHPAFTMVDPKGLADIGRTAPLHRAAEKTYMKPDSNP
jgi:TRAP transporter TAXI family solute receptor